MKITFIGLALITLSSCNTQDPQDKTIDPTSNLEQTNLMVLDEPLSALDLTDTTQFKLVALASVNSHRLSPEALQHEKSKIFNMQLSVKHFEWKNPTSGGAVHINKEDDIEVYNCVWMMDVDSTSKEVGVDELWHYVQGITYGNAPSVLLTSEYDLSKSKSIGIVMDELFQHTAQIYYLENNK